MTDKRIEAAQIAIRDADGCGLSLTFKGCETSLCDNRVFCDDPRLPSDERQKTCECKVQGIAAINAYEKALEDEGMVRVPRKIFEQMTYYAGLIVDPKAVGSIYPDKAMDELESARSISAALNEKGE